MEDRGSILYDALVFIAHHDEGDHGVVSFRAYARQALRDYYAAAPEPTEDAT